MPYFSGIADLIRKPHVPDPADPEDSEYRIRGRRYDQPYNLPPGMVTPPFIPNGGTPPVLPSIPTRGPIPLPGAGNPGAITPPTFPNHPQSRYGEIEEARGAYLQKTPGRGRAAVLAALRGAAQGLASGQGLAGAVGGALGGGLVGGINPRGYQEQRFNETVRPKMLERFRMEDLDAALRRQTGIDEQNAMMNRARLEDVNAGVDLKRSQAEKNRLPRPERPPPRMETPVGVIDPITGEMILPFPEKTSSPRWARDASGKYVDLNAPENKGKPVRGYDRPRAPKSAKEPKKFIAISDLRAWAEEHNMTTDQAGAKWRADGYTVTRYR